MPREWLVHGSLGSLRTGDAFRDWKDGLAALTHCIISTSTSMTGVFTITLLNHRVQFYPTKRKLVYCSRTVPEIEKALAELKRLMAYRIKCAETEEERQKEQNFMGLGLTSRKNLCINPSVRSPWFNPAHSSERGSPGCEGEEGQGSGRQMPRPDELCCMREGASRSGFS